MNLRSHLKNLFTDSSGTDTLVTPPHMYSPGLVDGNDLEEICSQVIEEMDNPEDLETEEYKIRFQTEAAERDDYGDICREILLEMGAGIEFIGEFSLRFEERIEEKIEYLTSEEYEFQRRDLYTIEPLFDTPKEDIREMN